MKTVVNPYFFIALGSLALFAAPGAQAGADSSSSCGRDRTKQERELDPCCNKRVYQCFRTARHDTVETLVVRPEGDDVSEGRLVNYEPVRFIRKKKTDRRDQSILKDAPAGALYREVVLREPGASSQMPVNCLSAVTLNVKKFLLPEHREDKWNYGYAVVKNGGQQDLYALRKNDNIGSPDKLVKVGEDGRLACGAAPDLSNAPLVAKIREIVPLDGGSGGTDHPFTMITWDGMDAQVWVGNGPAMRFPVIGSFGVNTQWHSRTAPLAIFTGTSYVFWIDGQGFAGQWRPPLGNPPRPKNFARNYFGIHTIREY